MTRASTTRRADQFGIIATGEATGIVDLGETVTPIQVIGTQAVRETIGGACIQQAISARLAPGVSQFVLNPDAHFGHGVPVGSVLVSPTHIYPGPVGVDIKCSMSLLQMDAPEAAIADVAVRRNVIREIELRLASSRHRASRGARNRRINEDVGFDVCVKGGTKNVLSRLDIPPGWSSRCEDSEHSSIAGGSDRLSQRLTKLIRQETIKDFHGKVLQLGSYGNGNHFGECEVVRIHDHPEAQQIAAKFGLKHGCVAFLSHCGSRGLGHALAVHQFRTLHQRFRKRGRAFPSGDPDLVYAEYGTPEADEYLMDMALGANFATVNHLLLNSIVLEAFQKVLPGLRGELVYFISHNIARREVVDGELQWVHRKGATRAFPAGHPELVDTEFADTGHPILLPGNPRDGSSILVASPGAEVTAFSVNHGAGRKMSRSAAKKQLTSSQVDRSLAAADVISNRRNYPIDEAPDAYKDFAEVVKSVELAGLAREIAKLHAKFVIKDT